jgi:hypothetical protein
LPVVLERGELHLQKNNTRHVISGQKGLFQELKYLLITGIETISMHSFFIIS